MKFVNHTIFPLTLIAETIAILKDNGAVFLRAADFWPDAARLRSELDYRREYAAWQSGRRGWGPFFVWCAQRLVQRKLLRRAVENCAAAGRPAVFLQHDADRNPQNTLAVMRLEQSLGVVSSNYFFRRRASRWEGDVEPYDLDLPAMKELERAGFEIGYHLNGPELANYDAAAGWRIIEEDVAFFRSHFNLRSFVPHGGKPSPGGVNNEMIDHRGCLDDLVWFYNGRSLGVSVGWSDGYLECPASRNLPDPREVARSVRGKLRARFLFHPQYYSEELRPNLDDVGLVETSWWRKLWSR